MSNKKNQKIEEYPMADLEEMGAGLRYTDWVLAGFKPWLKGTLCEVGAGTGNISCTLPDYGVSHLTLLEPDDRLFKTLMSKTTGHEQMQLFNETLDEHITSHPEKLFDAFLYVNVLEHIEDDVDELKRMYSKLEAGGVVLIFVPALQILFSENDRRVGHWRRYSRPELRRKLIEAGFEIEKIHYFDFIGTFVWFLACKLLKMNPSAGNVGVYDKVFVPVSRWIESICKPLFGKNLLAVAVKR